MNVETFADIRDIFPNLMEEIRLIWMLSTYYNSDRMLTVLERFTKLVCQSVRDNISTKQIFK